MINSQDQKLHITVLYHTVCKSVNYEFVYFIIIISLIDEVVIYYMVNIYIFLLLVLANHISLGYYFILYKVSGWANIWCEAAFGDRGAIHFQSKCYSVSAGYSPRVSALRWCLMKCCWAQTQRWWSCCSAGKIRARELSAFGGMLKPHSSADRACLNIFSNFSQIWRLSIKFPPKTWHGTVCGRGMTLCSHIPPTKHHSTLEPAAFCLSSS